MTDNIISHTPAEIVRKMLVDASHCNEPNTYGEWPAFHSQQPDQPDRLVIVNTIGGFIHGRNHVSGGVILHYGAEIIVRAVRGDSTGTAGHGTAWEKILSLCDFMDSGVRNTGVAIDTYTYTVHAANRVGDISRTGPDQTNRERYLFAVPYNLAITQH